MKRKAVANGIMLLMLILVGIYELYYVSAITMSGVRVSVKRYQEDMYALQNSLIAAKEYMKTAERYAVYQACYDNLKNGGWPDAVAPDSAKKDVGGAEYYFTIPENGFAEELGKSIAAGMNNYTSGGYTFMGAYSVSLPAYSEARITSHDASKMSVAATAGAPLSITRYVEVAKVGEGFLQLKGEAKEQNIMEKITLKKDSGIYQDVETPCFDLYERGAAYSETLSNLLNMQLNDEISGLLDDSKAEKKQTPEECAAVADAAKHRITDKLKAATPADVEVVELDLSVSAEAVPDADNSGQYVCTFTQTSEPKALMKVTLAGPDDKKFPVWSGEKLAFKPLKMVFLVGRESSKRLSASDSGKALTGNYISDGDVALSAPVILRPGSSLTLISGTISAAGDNSLVTLEGGSLYVRGGVMNGAASKGAVVIANDGLTEIIGGEIRAGGGAAIYAEALDASRQRYSVIIMVRGGTISSEGQNALVCKGTRCMLSFEGGSSVSSKGHAILATESLVQRLPSATVSISPKEGGKGENYYTYQTLKGATLTESSEVIPVFTTTDKDLSGSDCGKWLVGRYIAWDNVECSEPVRIGPGSELKIMSATMSGGGGESVVRVLGGKLVMDSGTIAAGSSDSAIELQGGKLIIIKGSVSGSVSSDSPAVLIRYEGHLDMTQGSIIAKNGAAVSAVTEDGLYSFMPAKKVSVTLFGGRLESEKSRALHCSGSSCSIEFRGNVETSGHICSILSEGGMVTRGKGVMVKIKPQLDQQDYNMYCYTHDPYMTKIIPEA